MAFDAKTQCFSPQSIECFYYYFFKLKITIFPVQIWGISSEKIVKIEIWNLNIPSNQQTDLTWIQEGTNAMIYLLTKPTKFHKVYKCWVKWQPVLSIFFKVRLIKKIHALSDKIPNLLFFRAFCARKIKNSNRSSAYFSWSWFNTVCVFLLTPPALIHCKCFLGSQLVSVREPMAFPARSTDRHKTPCS